MKDEFSRFHPTINFIYFAAVITFSTIYMNPILLSISFISGLIYSIYLDGRKSFRFFNLLYYFTNSSIFAALVNIAFNHNGMTILCYLPTGNPVTLESIIYGICAAVLFIKYNYLVFLF